MVWFGEVPYHLDAIQEAVQGCTHFLAIGTSGVVYPAAGCLEMARAIGAATFVNSLDPPENLNPRDRFHPGRAAKVVPGLLRGLLSEWGLGTPD